MTLKQKVIPSGNVARLSLFMLAVSGGGRSQCEGALPEPPNAAPAGMERKKAQNYGKEIHILFYLKIKKLFF